MHIEMCTGALPNKIIIYFLFERRYASRMSHGQLMVIDIS